MAKADKEGMRSNPPGKFNNLCQLHLYSCTGTQTIEQLLLNLNTNCTSQSSGSFCDSPVDWTSNVSKDPVKYLAVCLDCPKSTLEIFLIPGTNLIIRFCNINLCNSIPKYVKRTLVQTVLIISDNKITVIYHRHAAPTKRVIQITPVPHTSFNQWLTMGLQIGFPFSLNGAEPDSVSSVWERLKN